MIGRVQSTGWPLAAPLPPPRVGERVSWGRAPAAVRDVRVGDGGVGEGGGGEGMRRALAMAARWDAPLAVAARRGV